MARMEFCASQDFASLLGRDSQTPSDSGLLSQTLFGYKTDKSWSIIAS